MIVLHTNKTGSFLRLALPVGHTRPARPRLLRSVATLAALLVRACLVAQHTKCSSVRCHVFVCPCFLATVRERRRTCSRFNGYHDTAVFLRLLHSLTRHTPSLDFTCTSVCVAQKPQLTRVDRLALAKS